MSVNILYRIHDVHNIRLFVSTAVLGQSKETKTSSKSAVSNTDECPTHLSGMVHTVINNMHTFAASSSNVPSLQLKSTLPAYCTLNRLVTRAHWQQVMQTVVWLHSVCMNQHQVHHILKQQLSACAWGGWMFLYGSQNRQKIPTDEKYVEKNSIYRQQEQSSDTSRRKSWRQDSW